ncbi:MAG TPA: SPOR domain-containing protein [Chryseosolibacter sp.]|nr:SPOR domain-containing protein [Chryseosolibacter sp.]
MRQLTILFFSSALIFGCASKVTTGTSAGTGKYSEDLSVWRPEAEKVIDSVRTTSPERTRSNQYVEAKYAVNDRVDPVLDSIYRENLKKGSTDGYTIQVYSGVNREDALNVRKKMTQSLPDLESEVQYRQPNFRVRSGQYFTRLEAQQDYLAIKRYFPNAIVIPDRIPIQ